MESRRSGLFVYYRWLVLLLAAGLCLFPLWATFVGGFKSTGDLRTNAFGLPRQWLTDNYVSIATSARFWQMLGNSAFIAFVTVVLTLLISSMAAYVLAHLHFDGAITQNELAQRLLVTKGNVCGLIDRMETAGLVGRTADPADRRANRLRLTPQGTAILSEALPPHLALVKETMSRLRTAELIDLSDLLQRLDPAGDGGGHVKGCG